MKQLNLFGTNLPDPKEKLKAGAQEVAPEVSVDVTPLMPPPPIIEKKPELREHFAYWKLFVDGASRGNPGPAGAGVYITKDDVPYLEKGYYLGTKTNNQAEYLAMLIGIYYLKKSIDPKRDVVLIVSDSQLLIRQMQGQYKVKHATLQPLHAFAHKMLRGVNCQFMHVLREYNTEADRMANRGVDDKKRVSVEFVALLREHDISI
jgi:ribonuclease HI